MRRRQLDEKEAMRLSSTIAQRNTQTLKQHGGPVLDEFAIRSEAEGVVEESNEQTERRAEGVDEGGRERRGKIREKKLNQEEIGGRKKREDRPNQTGRGEASAGDWIMDTGGTRGCYPWARRGPCSGR
jgi:hypothetical protein